MRTHQAQELWDVDVGAPATEGLGGGGLDPHGFNGLGGRLLVRGGGQRGGGRGRHRGGVGQAGAATLAQGGARVGQALHGLIDVIKVKLQKVSSNQDFERGGCISPEPPFVYAPQGQRKMMLGMGA